MKLILKGVRPAFIAIAKFDEGERDISQPGPFALYTEDGQILPCQVSTTMSSEPGHLVSLTVKFTMDGDNIKIEGDA